MSLSRKTYGSLLALSCALTAGAQVVTGRITDEDGGALPFASVAVDVDGRGGTGATAGLEGDYQLRLSTSPATLAFGYVGYAPARREVPAGLTPADTFRLDIALAPARYTLPEAAVSATAEDPAYRIMRAAAARRPAYRRADPRYEAEVYVKGVIRVAEAPDKIMGRDIGDMGGLLDSSRAGIVYLSETFSSIQVEQPDKFRETVTASTVAGDPRGYSFNTATAFDFDLYARTADFGRAVLSPLVAEAPSVYRFTLEGARRTAGGRLVYRISVAPRSAAVAAYVGTVYVEEGSYHLLDADLAVAGSTLNAPGLDTLYVAQAWRRPRDAAPDSMGGWVTHQRRLAPAISLVGFRFRGLFAAVYTDYDFAPAWPTTPFGRIVSETLPGANEVDSAGFAERRPIPLSGPEQRDYARKDSIRRRVTSTPYRDSVQASRNAFGLENIGGYTWEDYRRHRRVEVSSPLTGGGFHPVTGLRLGLSAALVQDSDEEATRSLRAGVDVAYGFADGRLYPAAEVTYRLDPLYRQTVTLRGGRELVDYHRAAPVTPAVNAAYALLGKRSERKLYQRDLVEVAHDTRLHRRARGRVTAPWATLSHAVSFVRRAPRQVASQYSLRERDEVYGPNLPATTRPGADVTLARMPGRRLLGYRGRLDFAPAQRYILRPDLLVETEESVNVYSVLWRYGRGLDNWSAERAPHFLYVGLSAKRQTLRLGRFGRTGLRASAGRALFHGGPAYVVDAHQFGGSELPVNLYDDYLERYLALQHYGLATAGAWADGVVEHDFEGYLWQRLPLLRRLGWTLVARAGGVYLPDTRQTHAEVGAAINRIGFGPARLLRLDVTWATGREGGRPAYGRARWTKPVWRLGVVVPPGLLE